MQMHMFVLTGFIINLNNMDAKLIGYLAIPCSLSIAFLFMIKSDIFYGHGKKVRIIALVCVLLFLLSFIDTDDKIINRFIDAQKVPLPSLVVIKLNMYLFKRLIGRYPVNTYFVLEKKPWQDVVFNIFTFLELGIVFLLVLYFYY